MLLRNGINARDEQTTPAMPKIDTRTFDSLLSELYDREYAKVAKERINKEQPSTNQVSSKGNNMSKIYEFKEQNPYFEKNEHGVNPALYDNMQEAIKEFQSMGTGINVKITSGYRSFEDQRQARKRNGYTDDSQRAGYNGLPLVAIPGQSRHHRGDAMDVVISRNGKRVSKKEYKMLADFLKKRVPNMKWLGETSNDIVHYEVR
jgi:LAS superfamily LD-carboxypeptidase LdcB